MEQNYHNVSRENQKRALHPLKLLLPYLKKYRVLVLLAIIALITASCVMLALPYAIGRMLDNGFSTINAVNINYYFVVLFVLATILALASALRYYCVVALGEYIVADMRCDVFDHLMRLSPGFYDVSHSGELVSRLTADTTQIKSAAGAAASVALRNSIMAVGAIIMMIITSWKLSALVLVTIPIIVIPLIWFGRHVRKRTRISQDRLAQSTAWAAEQISAIRTVQAFTAEKSVIAYYTQHILAALDAARTSITSRSLLTGSAIFLVFNSVVAVLWIGSHDVINQTLSSGTLGQFVLYAVFAASSFGQLSEVGAELAQASGAAERINELLQEKPAIIPIQPVKILPKTIEGRIVFDHITFAYPSRQEQASLNDLSFAINPGETVALVGPSGAGKSTILSLLLRFYDPQQGAISLDGYDIRHLEIEDLRQTLSYVPQEVAVFNGSIRDNISFGSLDASDDSIIAAAKAANAYEFIENLPQGFDTNIGEHGMSLSGGQRQRIAIARAILRDAPILLLDEATSALDSESERLVQNALDGLMHHKTTLVIAHRLATVLKADRILVLDKGKIIEQGTHQTLIKQNGIYARLARLQFSDHMDAEL